MEVNGGDPGDYKPGRSSAGLEPSGSGDDDLAHRLGELARKLQAEHGVAATLDAIVSAAIVNVPGAAHASICTVRGRREVATVAATSDLARAVDEAQYRTGHGPCLDALFDHVTVRVADLAADDRWPQFTSAVHGLGLRSMLAIQLFVLEANLGALNLYSEGADQFDADAQDVALLFGAHAAIALASARDKADLCLAVDSRDLIGQAKGILMERHGLTPEQAFAVLARHSQNNNRKLKLVAADVVQGHASRSIGPGPGP